MQRTTDCNGMLGNCWASASDSSLPAVCSAIAPSCAGLAMMARFLRVSPSVLFPAGAATGLVGLVLLVLESTRALTGNVLGTVGEVLLWVGAGLIVVGAVLLLLAVVRSSDVPGSDGSDGGQPAHG